MEYRVILIIYLLLLSSQHLQAMDDALSIISHSIPNVSMGFSVKAKLLKILLD